MKSDPYLCEFYDVPKKEQKTCKKLVLKQRFCGLQYIYEKMVWHDQRFGDDVLTKQGLPNENMSRLKYLYQDWINAVYFGKGEIDQKMIDKLGDINWKFNCLFERWERIQKRIQNREQTVKRMKTLSIIV